MKSKAFSILAVFGVLILFSYYLFFIAFIFWVFLVIHLGIKDEKRYCHYKKYNRFAFFGNYFYGLYLSFDINNLSTFKDLLIGTIMFTTFSYFAFINKGFSIIFYASCFFSLIGFVCTGTFLLKYIRLRKLKE
jgi:hypothetical protein